MKKLVFATNNQHKYQEIQKLIKNSFDLISLNDLDFHEEIPETENTLEGNALQKARFIHNRFGIDCFSDDTGLEVEALDGEPGVYSARYAGENCSFEDNMDKLLKKLQDSENRKAVFRTVIALIMSNKTYYFEGKVSGVITMEKSGVKGFGYDPIFLPDGLTKTFAEIELSEKNKISHRARATSKLIEFLLK